MRALRGWLLLSILGLGVGGCAREKCAPAPPAEQLEPLPPPNDPAPADAPGEGEARYHLEQVADGLWAALQPDRLRYYDSNSVIIETSAGLVVVDAQSQLDAVAWLVDELQRRFDAPVTHVIVTHWHLDHVYGVALYRQAFPGVEVIAHAAVTGDLATRGAAQREEAIGGLAVAIEEARGRVATGKRRSGEPFTEAELAAARAEINAANDGLTKMRDTPLVPPTRAVAARETLEIGGVSLQLIPVSAHTDGDLLVYVAGARALISGDVVDALPFAGHGHPSAWIAALDQLKALDVAVVLPGHGPVFRGRDQLDRVRRLLVALVEHARAGAAAGESLEALQASLSLDELRAELVRDDTDARAFTRFVPEGLAAAYREATAP